MIPKSGGIINVMTEEVNDLLAIVRVEEDSTQKKKYKSPNGNTTNPNK